MSQTLWLYFAHVKKTPGSMLCKKHLNILSLAIFILKGSCFESPAVFENAEDDTYICTALAIDGDAPDTDSSKVTYHLGGEDSGRYLSLGWGGVGFEPTSS